MLTVCFLEQILSKGSTEVTEMTGHPRFSLFPYSTWVQRAKKCCPPLMTEAVHKSVIFTSPHAKFSSFNITKRPRVITRVFHRQFVTSPPSWQQAAMPLGAGSIDASLLRHTRPEICVVGRAFLLQPYRVFTSL